MSASTSAPAIHQRIDFQSLPVRLESDDDRVITLPFIAGIPERLSELVERIKNLPDEEAESSLDEVRQRFMHRHEKLDLVFLEHFGMAARLTNFHESISATKQLLIGSYFTMEYSFQSTALFNPSIVPHFDQTGVPEGGIRFIMSLRATGEGHISSTVFRTGVIMPDESIAIDEAPRLSARTRVAPDHSYHKWIFRRKLAEMSVHMDEVDRVLERLHDEFTFVELEKAIQDYQEAGADVTTFTEAVNSMLYLARSNYQVKLSPDADVSHLVLFPHSEDEAHGIEDMRLVRFVDDDASVTYYGTYTAYNGTNILPMLIETADFKRVRVHTLNGACALNKGMALFPRRINGHYTMCSRIDGHRLFIMYSDLVHFWESAEPVAEPKYSWELRTIGNCGSPIETDEGWLLLTHGVGPMRRYSLGAMLLDLENPAKLIGRLRVPLIEPSEDEREGYVPNVVYACGAMRLGERLYISYAVADEITRIGSVSLQGLIDQIKEDGP